MPEVFFGLAVILGLAALGGVAARLTKQPVMLGYVLAGLVISVVWRSQAAHSQTLQTMISVMGQLGVTLLLFLVGLELPIAELKKMGRVALISGLGQIIITSVLGYGLARVLGYDPITAIYLGIGMTFASTIVVVKLLSEIGDLQSLYGKITMGYLLVQDFVAIGLMVIMSGMAKGGGVVDWMGLLTVVIKGVVVVTAILVLSETVVKRGVDFLAQSTELLFIGSVGWCLVLAAVVASPGFGFPLEIGGFLAGLALASAVEQAEIISRVRPLRDFFLTWFFVALGAKINLGDLAGFGWSTMVMSVFVLLVSPVILMAIFGYLGFRKRVIFLASLTVAQVSEFSLILMAGAVSSGLTDPKALSVLTVMAVVTMPVSSYFILHANRLYRTFGVLAKLFERKKAGVISERIEKLAGHVVLFGHNRVGKVVRPVLEKMGFEVLVVDFNPTIIERLENEGTKAVYGDMADFEIYEKLGLEKAAAIISTVPDVRDELLLLRGLKAEGRKNRQARILTARDDTDATLLYAAGADYVLIPHRIGGEFLAALLESGKLVPSKA
ncbi:MAG: Sodium/hydrogen exchanger [Candidatus Amesbacteria bacterium GW2011_GWA2_47_11]|uniref:Sodium/hydrogen exchanger n=1 Tax=Candidatus Amesbacteria bacterium GW2011_GWA2_47_11 TaxID=1618357 RepID=A0A0G1RFP7_9BACT|nr:MAG: Sodium/hydrogen exchanger [Candidatus Amesbacteria bacterium GW2011_GWA2_47_11]